MSKHPEEAMDFLNYVAETSKAWDEPNPREAEKMRPATNSREGMYSITEDKEMKAKLSTLTKRLEDLEMRNHHEVRAVSEASMPNHPCFIFQSIEHQGEHYPTVSSVRDMMAEHANVVGQYKPPTNAPYGNTYNLNWRNHTNLSWKPKPPPYVPPAAQQKQCGPSSQPQPPPSSSPVEQAIMNLSKVVGNFVEEQKAVNAQANQRIDTVEGTLNKKLENLQSKISQKFNNLQYSISRLTNQQQVEVKGKFPSQTQPNPRGVHEVNSSNEPNPRMDEVKAIITLRSGKELKQPIPKPTEIGQEVKEAKPDEVVTKEPAMKIAHPHLFLKH